MMHSIIKDSCFVDFYPLSAATITKNIASNMESHGNHMESKDPLLLLAFTGGASADIVHSAAAPISGSRIMPRSNRSSSPLKPPDVESCMTPLSRPRARMFLRMVLTDQRLMSLWLNTLSFLEYMGARKIAKSLRQDHFNEELLGHLSEEAAPQPFLQKAGHEVRSPLCARQKFGLSPFRAFCGQRGPRLFSKIRP